MADVETVEVTSNGYRSRCLEESAGSQSQEPQVRAKNLKRFVRI